MSETPQTPAQTSDQTPAAAPEPKPRAEATYRLFGLGTDDTGDNVLRVVRVVGKRESLVAVPLSPVELAKLTEDVGSALREHLSGVRRR